MRQCDGCDRHVRATETACPFCGEALRTAIAPAPGSLAGLALGLVIAGCGPQVVPSDDDGGGDGDGTAAAVTGSSSEPGGSLDVGDTGSPDDTTGAPEPSTTTDDPGDASVSTSIGDESEVGEEVGGFYGIPSDFSEGPDCDLWLQDCPEGEKCMPWANDGGPSFNSARCSPLDPSPGAPGEACIVEGSPWSGIDDCDLGSICWHVEGAALQGQCVELCDSPGGNPVCTSPDDLCSEAAPELFGVCLTACDPLLADCPDGFACYPSEHGFVCEVPGLNAGELGDLCEFQTDCAPGHACTDGDEVLGCDGTSCCTPICDLGAPVCPDGTTCTPWFEEGMGPPQLEPVGACTIE